MEPARATIEVDLQHGDKCPAVFYIGGVRHVIEPKHNAKPITDAARAMLELGRERLEETAKRLHEASRRVFVQLAPYEQQIQSTRDGCISEAREATKMIAEKLQEILSGPGHAHDSLCDCALCQTIRKHVLELDTIAKGSA